MTKSKKSRNYANKIVENGIVVVEPVNKNKFINKKDTNLIIFL